MSPVWDREVLCPCVGGGSEPWWGDCVSECRHWFMCWFGVCPPLYPDNQLVTAARATLYHPGQGTKGILVQHLYKQLSACHVVVAVMGRPNFI